MWLNNSEKTNSRKVLKKMGYYKDQKGIINRYLRENETWEPHLQNSRDFILKSTEGKNKNHAIVLGSGWLLDIPVEELAEKFEKVTLVDIIHPRQIRKKLQKFSNIRHIETDLTGGVINQVYQKIQDYKKKKEIPMLATYQAESVGFKEEADFIISCNTITQLGILIKDYIRRFPEIPEKNILTLEKKLQEDHLKLLPKGKSCLITEFEEEIYDENNNLIGSNPLIRIPLPESNNQAKWQWKFDTKYYYREDAKTFMNVIAVDF